MFIDDVEGDGACAVEGEGEGAGEIGRELVGVGPKVDGCAEELVIRADVGFEDEDVLQGFVDGDEEGGFALGVGEAFIKAGGCDEDFALGTGW